MAAQNRQSQRSGDNGQQVQAAGNVTIYNIHTTADASRYLDESRLKILAQELSANALEIAAGRVAAYDADTIRRLVDDDNLEALGDPAFQLALNRSRITAGASERPADSDRLVELMAQRAKRTDRLVRASVEGSVEILDDVDESALQGLAFYLGATIGMPTGILLDQFLGEWSDLLSRIPRDSLPAGKAWLEHLHIVGAVRVDTSGAQTLRAIPDWIQASRPAFFSPGFANVELLDLFSACATSAGQLMLPVTPHELRPDFMRPVLSTDAQMTQVLRAQNVRDDIIPNVLLEFKNRAGFGEVDSSLQDPFLAKFREYAPLVEFMDWRNSLPYPVHPTQVGNALVWAYLKHVNAVNVPFDAMLTMG